MSWDREAAEGDSGPAIIAQNHLDDLQDTIDQLRRDRDELAVALEAEHRDGFEEHAGSAEEWDEHRATCTTCLLLARVRGRG